MKRPTIVLLALIGLLIPLSSLHAQVDRSAFDRQRQQMREQFAQQRNLARQQYADERRKAEEEYAAFRKKANEEYAAAMERAWSKMTLQPADPKPKEPTPPPPPPTPDPDKKVTTTRMAQAKVVESAMVVEAAPAPPIPAPAPAAPTMQFSLYGADCNVHTAVNGLRFQLQSHDERGAAAAWRQLSQEAYDGLLHDCLAQRDSLRLGDWGYLRLLQSAAERLQGKGTNEAVLLQMYLFAQSGYRVRLAMQGDRFVLMVPFSHQVYNYAYARIDGLKYYVLTNQREGNIMVCNIGMPKEQVASIVLPRLPSLGGQPQPRRTFTAEKFGTLTADISVDKAMIDFMNDYPLSDAWDNYVRAGLSDRVKNALYPVLRSQIEGKSVEKAAYMLLDFVQTAFDYATDDDQFGYERPLFGDESFYYPHNDCEDRSIVYSILVRDLLGLDVVLVDWPTHLATAVAFPNEVDGDYFTVDGRRYTVCDPTYEGAPVGMAMPHLREVNATLVKIDK